MRAQSTQRVADRACLGDELVKERRSDQYTRSASVYVFVERGQGEHEW